MGALRLPIVLFLLLSTTAHARQSTVEAQWGVDIAKIITIIFTFVFQGSTVCAAALTFSSSGSR